MALVVKLDMVMMPPLLEVFDSPDRRRCPDRRVADSGPPQGRAERRFCVERRGAGNDRRHSADRRMRDAGPPLGQAERRMQPERRGIGINFNFPGQLMPAPGDRRACFDRRMADDGPPPGRMERRFYPERRGLELEELDFDEQIVLGRAVGM
ncbi:MAG: hypothetical protein LBS70_10020 [Candidatus Accumulibacter sp.]|jgi:hypothetical protein|nr:hypothetical protein [Accumulibacter sp.]